VASIHDSSIKASAREPQTPREIAHELAVRGGPRAHIMPIYIIIYTYLHTHTQGLHERERERRGERDEEREKERTGEREREKRGERRGEREPNPKS
jgi:hypothetical protein